MVDGTVTIKENLIAKGLHGKNFTGAGVKGYPVLCDDNVNVRIYSNLRLDKYIEIPQDAVLSFYEPENPQDASGIIFKSTAEVKYVKSVPIPASTSASITTSFTMSVDEAMRILAQRVSFASPHALMMPSNCQTNCIQRLGACGSVFGFYNVLCIFGYILCHEGCDEDESGGIDGDHEGKETIPEG